MHKLIGIDGNEANIKERVGVNVYAFEVMWGIYRLIKKNRLKIDVVIFLKDKPLVDLPKQNDYWKYEVLGDSFLWILTKLTLRLFKLPKPDVFFSPNHYLPILPRVPKICTIHDLGYLDFSEQFTKKDYWQLRVWTAMSINVSKYIICVSKSTRSHLVRHYRKTLKKSFVVYHGHRAEKLSRYNNIHLVRQVLKKFELDHRYILFLSTLKPSKNAEGLIRAYKMFIGKNKEHHEVKLVVAGKKGWMYDSIFKLVKEMGLEQNVIFTGYVSEEEKMCLLKEATAFVLPSYWEGFGIDVINALALGTPTIVSRVASLPEVGGEAVFYCDPNSTESIKDKILKVITLNRLEYNRLSKKMKLQADKFSWSKTAQKTLSILLNSY